MTRDAWLIAHPYLGPLATWRSQVDAAVAEIAVEAPAVPVWNDYGEDFGVGVPLLRSPGAAIDLEPAGKAVVALVERLASAPSSSVLADDVRQLAEELGREPAAARRAVDWLLGEETLEPARPGLLRCLGWTALARHLAPVVVAFQRWREDERWLRSYCPTCGAPPAMAQLVGKDPGRKRMLACGSCGTRWQCNRTRCPFCEQDSQRLAVVTVQGEAGLRLDYCESCRAYVKTYDGEGDEALLLADWTSLHLDFVARDRGLKRLCASLYDLDALAG
jgi:FdhE protein